MTDIDNRIVEQIDFVASYAGDCDDWVTIKKEILKGISPNLRKNFSTRDPKTKEQWLSDFDKRVIIYYRNRTSVELVLRTLDERREMFDVI